MTTNTIKRKKPKRVIRMQPPSKPSGKPSGKQPPPRKQGFKPPVCNLDKANRHLATSVYRALMDKFTALRTYRPLWEGAQLEMEAWAKRINPAVDSYHIAYMYTAHIHNHQYLKTLIRACDVHKLGGLAVGKVQQRDREWAESILTKMSVHPPKKTAA